jgi:hypothetical protein
VEVRQAYTDTGETMVICEVCLQPDQLDELQQVQRPPQRTTEKTIVAVLRQLQQSMTEAGFHVVIIAQIDGIEYRIDGTLPIDDDDH